MSFAQQNQTTIRTLPKRPNPPRLNNKDKLKTITKKKYKSSTWAVSKKKKKKKNHCKDISKSSHKLRLINRKFTPYHDYVTTSVPTGLEISKWNVIIMSRKRMLKLLYKLAHSSASVGVSNIFKCSKSDVTTYVSARCIIQFQFVICE